MNGPIRLPSLIDQVRPQMNALERQYVDLYIGSGTIADDCAYRRLYENIKAETCLLSTIRTSIETWARRPGSFSIQRL